LALDFGGGTLGPAPTPALPPEKGSEHDYERQCCAGYEEKGARKLIQWDHESCTGFGVRSQE
jgi:hypothetical protein